MNDRNDRKYHTVFFDVGGTLLRIHPSVGEVYARTARQFGIEAEPEPIEAAMRREFRRLRERDLTRRAASHTFSLEAAHAWWRELVGTAMPEAAAHPRFDEFFAELFEAFARPEQYALFPEAEAALDRLAERGHRLGLISNWDERLRGVLEGLGLIERFDPIVISGEVKVEKPDPGIYELARAQAGARSDDRLLLIGDNPLDDVMGAQAAGFDARLVDRTRGHTLETVLGDLLGEKR